MHTAAYHDSGAHSVTTCWVDIDPASDPLVRVVGRAALSRLNINNKKRTYTIRGARVRFAVLGTRDMRMYLQLECTEDVDDNIFFAYTFFYS